MKNIFVLLVISAITFTACKKDKDPEPEPAPAPAPVKIVSVKVNGAEKQCSTGSCYSSSKSGGSRSASFYLNGSVNESIYISCDVVPATGTHNLVKYGEPLVIYMKDNTYYRAVNGSLNISAIDTSNSGTIRKLVATFSFQTDTTGGQFFNLTDGSLNLNP